jgi:hypothetical protein
VGRQRADLPLVEGALVNPHFVEGPLERLGDLVLAPAHARADVQRRLDGGEGARGGLALRDQGAVR